MDLIGLFSKTTGSLLGKKAGGNVRVDTALIKNLEDVWLFFSFFLLASKHHNQANSKVFFTL